MAQITIDILQNQFSGETKVRLDMPVCCVEHARELVAELEKTTREWVKSVGGTTGETVVLTGEMLRTEKAS